MDVQAERVVNVTESAENMAVHNTETGLDTMPLSQLLAVAGHMVAMRWQRLMGSHGLTPHGLAVLASLEQGPALTQRELARRCGVAPSTLNHTVGHLERSGWIERSPDATDRRLVRLAMTAHGLRQLERVRQAVAGEIEPLLDHLPASDVPLVRAFLIDTVARFQVLGPRGLD
jgi:DNA-binding MarR family transcriptional regulator